MKLLSKYYRVNILATIIVVLFSSICYYFTIHYILIEQLDNSLKVEEQEVLDFIKEHGSLPAPSSYNDQEVSFKPSISNAPVRKFRTTDSFNKDDHEPVATRELIFPVNVNGTTYDVFVRKSQEETEDLIQLILGITLLIVVLLLLIVFLINRFVLRRLWKPFKSTLSQLKHFDLTGKNRLQLEPTKINEFRELNEAVTIMAKHVSQEYGTLKRFTENASHEMQTPLAIINSKLDLLIQGDNINEQQMGQLQGIYDALERLSKMNQSLLLLTRIENNQFNETAFISLDNTIKEKLLYFDELIVNKKLIVNTAFTPLNINCNRQLLDILLSNLLNNAIRYNTVGGTISITVKEDELIISNSSLLPALDGQKVFQRFYRHANSTQEGNGLGLSIVKQICHDFGYAISYFFSGGHHEFHIKF
ncbi:HAMP domain-containing sensor histidine kinase [soil metagenome]